MKKLTVILLFGLVCLIVLAGAYAIDNAGFFHWGEQSSEMNEAPSSEAIATVNGVEISKTQFDSYKIGLANASKAFSDEEILQKLIRQEVLMQEVIRLGYSVNDDEVNAFNDERFALLEQDPEAYKIVKDYVDGMGITMDEYKEMSKKISKEALLVSKYEDDIREEFAQLQQGGDFENYYNDKIDSLCEQADIEICR